MDLPVMEPPRWERLTDLFERLLAGEPVESALAAETDPEMRAAVLELWRHHLSADREDYLEAPLDFEVAPVFRPGQVLLGRFRIERMLGRGGMGEVYLAWDERVEDRVALKTIARLLAPSPSIRRRFVAEVQNARRVTHRNVCRIHELFEDRDTVFFSMELLEGVLLPDYLERDGARRHARALAIQLAEGLRAAHQIGVVHGDLKPGNVMVIPGSDDSAAPRAVLMDFGLARAWNRAGAAPEDALSVRAGSVDYMAPELRSGAVPTVRSDIYAFGKVGAELLPKERIWEECVRTDPNRRPENVDPILRRLDGRSTRRYWLGGAVVASAGAAAAVFRPNTRAVAALPANARILVNGFQAIAASLPGAKLLRSLLLTSLRQSPRIHAVDDRDLLPSLKGAALPLRASDLASALAIVRAAYWIDGELGQFGARYSLNLRLMSASGSREIAATAFHDAPNVLLLARSAALWIRAAAGESGRALALNPADATTYTSSVPEALDKYFDGMERSAVGKSSEALPLFQEAVRLDPNFAQAHHMLALTINWSRRYEEGLRELEIAHQLSARLPERERTPIDTSYYRMIEDPARMIAAAKQNVAYHPDEPRYYASLAQAQINCGEWADGVASYRAAMALAPNDSMQSLLLMDALVEAGRADQALDEYRRALSGGNPHPWVHNGGGAAYLALERYAEATQAFANEPLDSSNAADLQSAAILEGRLESALAIMREQRSRVDTPIEEHEADEFICGLSYVTGRIEQARRSVASMAELPPIPPSARRLAGTASWARRTGSDDVLARVIDRASLIARQWPNSRTEAAALHARALAEWRQGRLDEAEALLLRSCGMAFDIWSLYDLADLFTARAKWDEADAYWQRFEDRRGTVIVKVWFPGILVLGWLNHAAVALARRDRTAALRYSRKVLDHWARLNPHIPVVRTAQDIHLQARS